MTRSRWIAPPSAIESDGEFDDSQEEIDDDVRDPDFAINSSSMEEPSTSGSSCNDFHLHWSLVD